MTAGMRLIADAERAKHTGGMIALRPRRHDAEILAVPHGEPVEDLHLTLVYLGENVVGKDHTALAGFCDHLATVYGPISAKIFGFSAFSPNDPSNSCLVYLVGESPDISSLVRELRRFAENNFMGLPPQHDPFIPHITAIYSQAGLLDYTGPVLFDRLTLNFAGREFSFNL